MKTVLLFFIISILSVTILFAQEQDVEAEDTDPQYSIQDSSDLYIEGAALAANGQYEEAIQVFHRVIELSPYYALGHYGLGKIYLYYGDGLDLAVKELKLAVLLDDRLAKAHFYLGMAYYLNKQYAYAVTSYKRSYQLDDRYLEAIYNIGSIYDFMGHPNKSLLYYKMYLDEKERELEYFDY